MSLKSDALFEKIRARIEKIDPNDRKVQHTYKFVITVNGAVAKHWILDLKNVKLTCGDGAAEVTLTVSDDDLYAIGTGALPTKDALAQDKLDIDGELELAMLLTPFISSL